jgi:hypothetical protein
MKLNTGNTIVVGMQFRRSVGKVGRRYTYEWRCAYPEIVERVGDTDLWGEYEGRKPSVARVLGTQKGISCLVITVEGSAAAIVTSSQYV